MNSRNKGKRGERQWRDELRAHGYHARRGQQFAGGADSPDVICAELDWIHFEVKAVERLNLEDAMEQARRDSGASRTGHPKIPVVAHKRNFRPWLVTITAEFFFRLLRGDVPDFDSVAPAPSARNGISPTGNGAPALAESCPNDAICCSRDKQTLGRSPSDPNLRGVLPPEDKPKHEQNKTEIHI